MVAEFARIQLLGCGLNSGEFSYHPLKRLMVAEFARIQLREDDIMTLGARLLLT